MSAGRYCASCGAPREPNARFCAKCGASLAVAAAPAEARSPSAVPPAPRATSPARRGPPWKRIAAIAIGLAVVVGVVAALVEPTPEPEEPLLGLGTATAKDPAPDRFVASKAWGVAPADQVIVRLRAGSMRADADRIAAQLGATVVGEIAYHAIYQLETPGRTAAALDEAVAKAAKADGVEVALANVSLVPDDTSGTRCDPFGDPSYKLGSNARPYEIIGLGVGVEILKGSGVTLNAVRVGVLDHALYTPSGEFSGQVKVRGDTTKTQFKDAKGALDEGGQGHGTSVASIIAATFGNGGVAGVASVLGERLTLSMSDVHRGGTERTPIAAADPKDPTQVTSGGQSYIMRDFVDATRQIDQGATVINMSFHVNDATAAGKRATIDAWRAFIGAHPNVLFVATAGNDGKALDGANYAPGGIAGLGNLVTVGAIDSTGRTASWDPPYVGGSNTMGPGSEVTLAAVGKDVMVGIGPDGKPITASGTSFAAPQVTATAALLRAIDPDLTAAKIKTILAETGAPGIPGKDAAGNDISVLAPAGLGGKILRVDNAIERVINDLRARQVPPLPKIDRAAIRALAVIDVSAAQTETLRWNVTAKVPGVGTGGTDVKIESLGQGGAVGGTKHLGAAGSVAWPYTFANPQDGAAVTVTRIDTGACARVSFKAGGAAPVPPAGTGPIALQPIVEAALRATGHTWKVVQPGEQTPSGSLLCFGGTEPYCTFWQTIPEAGPAQPRESLQLQVNAFPVTAKAEEKFVNEQGFHEEAKWTQETYRGLRSAIKREGNTALALRTMIDNPGIYRGWDDKRNRVVLAGTFVIDAFRTKSCTNFYTPGSPEVKCGAPAPLSDAQPEIDAVINELVRAGLVPAGTVR